MKRRPQLAGGVALMSILLSSFPFEGQSVSSTGSSLQQPPDPSTVSAQVNFLVGQVAGSDTAPPLPFSEAIRGLRLFPPGCIATTMHVDAAALKGGDGSANAPFNTLRETFAAADENQACGLRALVARGKYAEGPLVVNRPSIVAGRASGVVVEGSFEVMSRTLVLASLTVVGDGQSLQPAVLAMFKSTVAVLNVNLIAPPRHGIRVHGGTLVVRRVDVSEAWTVPDDPSSGSAVHLTGGVNADLGLMRLSRSVRGLYAGDAGTRVRADSITIEDTTIHPTRIANVAAGGCPALGFRYLGAVEIDSAAVLTGVEWVIQRTQLASLYAHDDGYALLSQVAINDTRQIVGECGGTGAVAHRGGAIELRFFAITNSELCGVAVGGAPGSAIDLRRGLIDFAPVGACVQQVGYDTSRLRNHVDYRTVGIPLQSTSYELPDYPPEF